MKRKYLLSIPLLVLALWPRASAHAQDPRPTQDPQMPPVPEQAPPPTMPPPQPLPPAPPTAPLQTPATGTAQTTDAAGHPVTVTSHHASPAQEDLQAEFAAFDTNRDGGISPGEARADKYMARSFRTLDADRDGRLQFEEVREWLDE